MRLYLHAEWTKLRTVPGPLWLLLGTVAATVGLGAGATAVTCMAAGCGGDPTRVSLLGVYLGQALVAILGVLVISGEYSTGLIRTTLTAMPNRATTLAAKAVMLTGVVAVAGTVAVLGSLLAGRLILAGRGVTALSLRATVGSILYLMAIGLLSLGVAAIVRDSATSIGVVLGLLYLFPVLARTIGNPHWQRLLEEVAPWSPISPWAGLGAAAGWAGVALLAGGWLLRVRDS